MLSLKVFADQGVRLTGVYVQRNGHFVPADVLVVVKTDWKLHFYAPREVQIGRLGPVDDVELLRAALASRKQEVRHG